MADAPQFHPGQDVAVIGYRGRVDAIKTVAKVGKIHVSLGDGRKFRLSGWLAGGNGWDNSRIEPATDEHREAFRRRVLVDQFGRFQSWDKLSTSQLERIAGILKEAPDGR